jgi:hypothetical protein
MDEAEELKGRINILEQQRNDAMNQNVILGGQLQIALNTIKDLQDGDDQSADEQESSSGSLEGATE